MTMLLATAARYAPSLVAAPAASVAVRMGVALPSIYDVAAVLLGMIAGTLWRAGHMRADRKSWQDIWDDLAVSTLIGSANGVGALLIVDWLDAQPLPSVAIGVLVAVTGVRFIQEVQKIAIDELRRRLGGGGH